MPTSRPKDEGADAGELSQALQAPRFSRVARINLIRREVRESLSPNALELLFSGAELVVESGRDPGGRALYCTVMLTFDLSRSAALVREPADAETARRLCELMGRDPRVQARLQRLARPYLSELAERSVPAREIDLDFTMRHEDDRILIDADAMVSLQALRSPSRVGGDDA